MVNNPETNKCMIIMEHQEEIPCASCHSWNSKQKRFSCNPNQCKGLSEWMNEHGPQTITAQHIQAQSPETAIQYVV